MSRRVHSSTVVQCRRLLPARPCAALAYAIAIAVLVVVNVGIATLYLAPSWMLGSRLHAAKVELHTAVVGSFTARASLATRMDGVRCLSGQLTATARCAAAGVSGPQASLKQQQALLPWLREDIGAVRKRWTGRGIVLTAGNGQADAAVALVRALAEVHHSSLPVEVWYRGEEDLSLREQQRLESQPLVRRVTTLQRVMADADWHAIGPRAKPFAALFSSFSEVLLLDADAVLVGDPAAFFDAPEYARTGTLFFRDRCAPLPAPTGVSGGGGGGAGGSGGGGAAAAAPAGAPLPPLLELLATLSPGGGGAGAGAGPHPTVAPPPAKSPPGTAAAWAQASACTSVVDAALVVIDKARVLWPLIAAAMLNDLPSRAVLRAAGVPSGDREAWWLAPHALGTPYGFAPGAAGTVGVAAHGDVCASSAAHSFHTLGGAPAWWDGGLRRDGGSTPRAGGSAAAGGSSGDGGGTDGGAAASGDAGTFVSWALAAEPANAGQLRAASAAAAAAAAAASAPASPVGWTSPECVATRGAGALTAAFTPAEAARIAAMAKILKEET